MNYQHDNIFLIGKTHKICQDYAYSDSSCLIITDGCSGSPNSDIGARILAQCAKTTLQEFTRMDYRQFGYSVITKARVISDAMRLNKECLDATLIVAFPEEDYIRIFMYGDGVIINNQFTPSENLELKRVVFASGAPYYLSYWIDKERLKGYHKEFNGPLFIKDSLSVMEANYDYETSFTYFTTRITIASDGLTSFFSPSMGIKIAEPDIVISMTSFKTLKGEFLKRRVLKVVQDYAKRNIYHMDDIALASYTYAIDLSC